MKQVAEHKDFHTLYDVKVFSFNAYSQGKGTRLFLPTSLSWRQEVDNKRI